MLKFFKRTPISAISSEMVYDAERKLLEHETAAEHHAALAAMYRARVQRMRSEYEPRENLDFKLDPFRRDFLQAGTPAH